MTAQFLRLSPAARQSGRHARLFLFCTATALSLAACGKEPTGQVVAVVNGDEVTMQEVNAELARLNVPETADKKRIQQQVLQQIVDRRLIAQAAAKDGLDRDPTYLVRQRQLSEALLVQMYGDNAGKSLRVPDAAAIDRYIAEHPASFAGRSVLTLDQLQFPLPSNPERLRALEGAKSIAEAATILTRLNIPFQRGTSRMDTGQIPQQMMAQIQALPPGEPFIVPGGGVVTVNVITGREATAVPDAQARALAVQAMRNEQLGTIMQDRLKGQRATAKIEYQSGYEAPATPGAPASRTAPAAAPVANRPASGPLSPPAN